MVDDLCSHLLILHQGNCRFFGPITEARDALGAGADVTLEEIFFRITEGHADSTSPTPPPVIASIPGPPPVDPAPPARDEP
jgi:hypothetical protein